MCTGLLRSVGCVVFITSRNVLAIIQIFAQSPPLCLSETNYTYFFTSQHLRVPLFPLEHMEHIYNSFFNIIISDICIHYLCIFWVCFCWFIFLLPFCMSGNLWSTAKQCDYTFLCGTLLKLVMAFILGIAEWPEYHLIFQNLFANATVAGQNSFRLGLMYPIAEAVLFEGSDSLCSKVFPPKLVGTGTICSLVWDLGIVWPLLSSAVLPSSS